MAGITMLSDQGLRLDGRRPNELRKISCNLGAFSQADGSAYIEQGNTKVLAAVYGPHEITGSKSRALHDRVLVNCQYSMATFSTGERKRRPRGDRKSIEMTLHMQQTFEAAIHTQLYPKSQIDIFVEVLQSDGGNYCASINAATLALIDAGIPMKDIVCASSASLIKDTPIVDINHMEETHAGVEVVLAILPKTEQIVFLQINGRIHEDHSPAVTELGMKGCLDVHAVLDRAVRHHIADTMATMGE
ncbi:exosome complex component RRP41-like [Watersipora subatra]|uniref:exosome complex component RRP41-like n=1 Tax=Watersipora subatra TaxID=2589382 RepID=UPI00355C3837